MSEQTITARYQLLPPLSKADRQRLRDSIEREGLLEPVVRDADTGEVLDGHHREALALELGVPVEYRDVKFADQRERELYALTTNLVRRRLSDRQWGEMFQKLVTLRGAKRGAGARNDTTGVTVTQVAAEQGVSQRTAERRMDLADELESYPEIARQYDEAQATSSGKNAVPQKWAKKVAADEELRGAVEANMVSLKAAISTLKAKEKDAKDAAEAAEREAAARQRREAGEQSRTLDEIAEANGAPHEELPEMPRSSPEVKAKMQIATLNGVLSRYAPADVAAVPRDADSIEAAREIAEDLRRWLDRYDEALEARLKPQLTAK